MKGVRKDYDVKAVTRTSPRKVYSGAKSKVARNIKSVNKANAKKYYDKLLTDHGASTAIQDSALKTMMGTSFST